MSLGDETGTEALPVGAEGGFLGNLGRKFFRKTYAYEIAPEGQMVINPINLDPRYKEPDVEGIGDKEADIDAPKTLPNELPTHYVTPRQQAILGWCTIQGVFFAILAILILLAMILGFAESLITSLIYKQGYTFIFKKSTSFIFNRASQAMGILAFTYIILFLFPILIIESRIRKQIGAQPYLGRGK